MTFLDLGDVEHPGRQHFEEQEGADDRREQDVMSDGFRQPLVCRTVAVNCYYDDDHNGQGNPGLFPVVKEFLVEMVFEEVHGKKGELVK